MSALYAALIVKGAKTFADVPATLKEQVREILITLEVGELAQQKQAVTHWVAAI